MTDKQVGLTTVATYAMWGATILLVLMGWVADAPNVGRMGLAMSAAAATATIRGYIFSSQKLIRDAFQAGRDQAQNGIPRPRSIHRDDAGR